MSEIIATPAGEVKRPRTRKPPVRTMRIEEDPFLGGFVRLTIDGKATTYKTKEIPVDPEYGAAFGFLYQKVDEAHQAAGEPYYLCASSRDPAAAKITCDCLGFTRWARCKHEASLRVLMVRRRK